ncbi:hypothetical protein OEA41_005663 [Lepraria neglecta]|uniref:NAD(P)-binding protein n=1 Tax=Lepraria neglecta TaxID=209136 RepID=A0AAD9Z9S6_9LECA|nr:hypothetical protein OEA41_005663 [Lepraria neglecta]
MASKPSLNGFALITGAASGIGQETGFSFAEAGASGVLFADINKQGAQESAEMSKKFAKNPEYRAIAVKVDVTDPESVQSMVDTAIKEFGRIDHSVNSAGVSSSSDAPVSDLSLEDYARITDTNIKGTMLCVRAVSKAMSTQEPLTYEGRRGSRSLGRGSIVNMGSASSYVGTPGTMSYTTSKHAIIGLTKTAAQDNKKHHIRVNAICPSWVDTPMMERILQRKPQLEQVIEKVSPLERMAEPEEVADVIVFLCSPSASYVNGTGLLVDAGLTLSVHTA